WQSDLSYFSVVVERRKVQRRLAIGSRKPRKRKVHLVHGISQEQQAVGASSNNPGVGALPGPHSSSLLVGVPHSNNPGVGALPGPHSNSPVVGAQISSQRMLPGALPMPHNKLETPGEASARHSSNPLTPGALPIQHNNNNQPAHGAPPLLEECSSLLVNGAIREHNNLLGVSPQPLPLLLLKISGDKSNRTPGLNNNPHKLKIPGLSSSLRNLRTPGLNNSKHRVGEHRQEERLHSKLQTRSVPGLELRGADSNSHNSNRRLPPQIPGGPPLSNSTSRYQLHLPVALLLCHPGSSNKAASEPPPATLAIAIKLCCAQCQQGPQDRVLYASKKAKNPDAYTKYAKNR